MGLPSMFEKKENAERADRKRVGRVKVAAVKADQIRRPGHGARKPGKQVAMETSWNRSPEVNPAIV